MHGETIHYKKENFVETTEDSSSNNKRMPKLVLREILLPWSYLKEH
jgi:hypothetical protein